jgi:hypothetical protein
MEKLNVGNAETKFDIACCIATGNKKQITKVGATGNANSGGICMKEFTFNKVHFNKTIGQIFRPACLANEPKQGAQCQASNKPRLGADAHISFLAVGEIGRGKSG